MSIEFDRLLAVLGTEIFDVLLLKDISSRSFEWTALWLCFYIWLGWPVLELNIDEFCTAIFYDLLRA